MDRGREGEGQAESQIDPQHASADRPSAAWLVAAGNRRRGAEFLWRLGPERESADSDGAQQQVRLWRSVYKNHAVPDLQGQRAGGSEVCLEKES